MKKRIYVLFGVIFLLLSASSGFACTGFTASDEDKILVGINEDNQPTKRYVEIYPPEEGKYGKILFGYQNAGEQQGMNDQGLFWDGFSCPYLDVTKGKGLTPIPDPEYLFNVVITENCSTIYDVIDILDSHDIRDLPIEICQVLFVDRFGNSVIFEGDDYVFKEEDFQVVTNFYQTHPELGGYGFDRYDIAYNMLEDMNQLSMDYFRNICEATHQEWPLPYPRTIYSLVCDLTNNKINYYYEYNYHKVWEINLTELFEYGRYTYDVLKVLNNDNPNKPDRPDGPKNGKTGKVYSLTASTTDKNGDQIYYKWDFGDGNISEWLGPYGSGALCQVMHTWNTEGQYNVRVMARDTNCGKSDWSDSLIISMPKTIDRGFSLMDMIIELINNINQHFQKIFWDI